ncbi:MAG: hypothetical protein QW040_02440 [Candidatus Aenigmatarchaeota archaeon]
MQEIKNVAYKPTLNIMKPATEFVNYCSRVVKPSQTCVEYRNKLLEAYEELLKVLEERKRIDEEFKWWPSFLRDVSIGILNIMNDEEFESVKKLGLKFIKELFE